MKIFYTLTGLSLLLTVSLSGCATAKKSACDGIIQFEGKTAFKFNENEDLLLCGDDQADGWKNIPFSQREFMVRSYLKDRSYHHVNVRFDQDQLIVDPGTKSRIKQVIFKGAPAAFYYVGYVGWRGAELKSTSLDEIQGWTSRRLHEIGYPCAKVDLTANADTEVVEVKINSGSPELFPEPSYDESRPFNEGVMRRYDAFQVGNPYDERLTQLTSSRMSQDGVVFKSYFSPECDNGLKALRHRVAVGDPRLLKLGVGASTEELVFFKGSWRNTRLGSGASSFYVDTRVSKIRQSIQAGLDWYFSDYMPRWYLQPIALLERRNEKYQKYANVSFSPLLVNQSDFTPGTLISKFGPAVNFENTYEGLSVGGKTFYRLETEFNWSDYPYQIYLSSPRDGHTFTVASSSIVKSRYTTAGVHRLRFEGTKLWNLGRYDPAQIILGVRFSVHSVLVGQDQTLRDSLPSDFYSFLGGEQNVRGFSRQELPLDAVNATGPRRGSLSSAYTGFESRFPMLLPAGLDPLVFTDWAWFGSGNFGFESTLFFSPGIGLRYQSPIGAVRTTLARGFVLGDVFNKVDAEHIQFFLSLGREF